MPFLTRERGAKKRGNEVAGKRRPDNARTETEDVQIVVLHGLPGGVAVVAHGGADAGKLVGGDGDAGAAAAHDDPTVCAPIAQRRGNRLGTVGIVDRRRGVSAEVQHVVPLRAQRGCKVAFHFIAGVIRGKGDTHGQLS